MDNQFVAELNRHKIEEDEQWDGLHGILTNTELSAKAVVERYKKLWVIEEAFTLSQFPRNVLLAKIILLTDSFNHVMAHLVRHRRTLSSQFFQLCKTNELGKINFTKGSDLRSSFVASVRSIFCSPILF